MVTAAVIGRQLRVSAYQGEERREVMLEPTLISENFLFLRQAILAGLGIGLVPDYVVNDDVRRGEVRDHARRLAAQHLRHADVHALHAEPAAHAGDADLHRFHPGAGAGGGMKPRTSGAALHPAACA